jgi:hypothetical protein
MTHFALAAAYKEPVGSPTPERAYIHALFRGLARHPVVLLGILLLVAAAPLIVQARLTTERSARPADLFME